ncbi:MAG: AI-2E family transporter [Actinomycetota bacterium]|nr:AI-2E family transporter [Actinomycetota bacterium]
MLEPMPNGLRKLLMAGAAAWAVVGLLVVLAVIVWALQFAGVVVPPVLIALVLVYLLAPLVRRLEQRRLPRPLAVVAIYVSLVAVMTLIGFLLVPVLASQFTELAQQLPAYLEDLRRMTAGVESWLRGRGIEYSLDPQRLLGAGGAQTVLAQAGRVGRVLSGTVSFLLAFIVGPILAFYVLLDLPRLQQAIVRLIPKRRRDRVLTVARDVNGAVGAFIRGQMLVAAAVAVLSIIALVILRVPSALVIGLMAGASNLIPFVGPIVGGAIAAIVAWATRGAGTALWTVGAFVVIQQIESHVLSPTIVGKAVKLHPAVVIIAIILGAAVAGVWGMLLVIPLVAGFKAAAVRIWFPDFAPDQEPAADPAEDSTGEASVST